MGNTGNTHADEEHRVVYTLMRKNTHTDEEHREYSATHADEKHREYTY